MYFIVLILVSTSLYFQPSFCFKLSFSLTHKHTQTQSFSLSLTHTPYLSLSLSGVLGLSCLLYSPPNRYSTITLNEHSKCCFYLHVLNIEIKWKSCEFCACIFVVVRILHICIYSFDYYFTPTGSPYSQRYESWSTRTPKSWKRKTGNFRNFALIYIIFFIFLLHYFTSIFFRLPSLYLILLIYILSISFHSILFYDFT